MKLPPSPQREPTTTITINMTTAETIRRLVGEMQHRTGRTITQRTVIDAALEAYKEKIKEEKK